VKVESQAKLNSCELDSVVLTRFEADIPIFD
jgi:hypothetical protein